ncbi:MAG TPA: hypothetical protein VGC32_14785 [Solirubrobacterales bacterium]
MRAKTIAAVLGSAAIVGLSLPGGAIAQDVTVGLPGATGKSPTQRGGETRLVQRMNLSGTNGFKITIRLEDRRRLTLTAKDEDRRNGSLRSVEYSELAPQSRGSADIDARLGNLGRIDVRFIPTKTVTVRKGPKCATAGIPAEIGHYVGTISFRGEHGFTRVLGHSAPGSVGRESQRTCAHPEAVEHGPKTEKKEAESIDTLEAEEGARKEGERNHVQLIASLPGRGIAFSAGREEFAGPQGPVASADFVVFGLRQRGRLRETAVDLIFFGGGSYFRLTDPSNPTAGASIDPPAPFTGSATFTRESAQPPSWTGDLRADLPGFGDVRLAGPGVEASMCAPPDCGARESFSRPLPPQFRALR